MTTIREVRPDQHGSITGYRYGCRCIECRQAERVYRKGIENSASPEAVEAIYSALVSEADMDGLVTSSSYRVAEVCGYTQKHVNTVVRMLQSTGRLEVLGRGASCGGALVLRLQEVDL